MHTIPQNVTSYEDKIVGALIGRQFVYLAIGGITIFILLSTSAGPLFIRFFISILVGAFSAAMALLKINERGFDTWVFSFLKAILGPTEWVWQKHELPLHYLVEQDVPEQTVQTKTEENPQRVLAHNLERLQQFEQYLAEERGDLDSDEVAFVTQLNFAETVPQGAFVADKSTTPPPPMLTPAHPKPMPTMKAEPKQDTVFAAPQIKPLTSIAQSTAKQLLTIRLDGHTKDISMMSNQRVNRSLSRQLLSGGTLPLPVRGELQISLSKDLKTQLTDLIGYAPAGTIDAVGLTQIAAAQQKMATPTMSIPSITLPPVKAAPSAPVDPAPAPSPQPASPAAPASPWQFAEETKTEPVNTPPATPSSPAPDLPESQTKYIKPTHEQGDVEHDQNLQQELAAAEDQAREAIAALDQQPGPATQSVNSAQPEPTESGTATLAQAAANESAESGPSLAASHPSFLDELKHKLVDDSTGGARPGNEAGLHYIPPILNHSEGLAAAGAPASVVTPVDQPQPNATDKALPLTSAPNVINGVVWDSTGQFAPGVVVVVKDGSGEPKRALKTNKLGQFVIQTPLDNGTYTVEVDKKGLSFDIMRVDLTGAVLPPIEIHAKVS